MVLIVRLGRRLTCLFPLSQEQREEKLAAGIPADWRIPFGISTPVCSCLRHEILPHHDGARQRPPGPCEFPRRHRGPTRWKLAGKPHGPPRRTVCRHRPHRMPVRAAWTDCCTNSRPRAFPGSPCRPCAKAVEAPVKRRTLVVDVVGNDRPGIVRELTAAIANAGGNVEELTTGLESAPMSGHPMFRAHGVISIPENAEASVLTDRHREPRRRSNRGRLGLNDLPNGHARWKTAVTT